MDVKHCNEIFQRVGCVLSLAADSQTPAVCVQLAFLNRAVDNSDCHFNHLAACLPARPPPCAGARTGLESKPRELSQAGLCEQREGNDTGRKKKQIKEKTQQQLGLHQPPARAPHCARAPPPSGSGSRSLGPERVAPPSTGPRPAAASSGCAGRAARKEAAKWALRTGAALEGRGSQNPRPGREAAKPERGGRAPAVRSPGRAGCPCLSGGGPGSSSPQPGAGRREAARAQAGAVATLTHGGDGGGGGSGPSVTSAAGAACRGPGRRGRQRAWLRAGGAGCARGPRRLPRLRLRLRPRPGAVAWAGWPATSPALLGSAQPGLGGAARPARPPVPQSRSRSVRPPFSTSGTLRKTNRWSRSSPPCLSLTPALANPSQPLAHGATPHSLHHPITRKKSLPPPPLLPQLSPTP